MRADIERWNRKFAGRQSARAPEPDALLTTTRHLPAGGGALDVASGSGHNAVWLASRGFEVTAVDGSVAGMKLALELARRCAVTIRPLVADLDTFETGGAFDLVIVMHYLNRPLYRRLARYLAPGGTLIAKTFNRDHLRAQPRFNPDYVLNAGELPVLFDGLTIIEHGESPPEDAARSYIICQK